MTHHHDDHSGFVADLVRDTGAKIIVHEQALPFLKTGTKSNEMKFLNLCTKTSYLVYLLFRDSSEYPPVIIGPNDIVIKGDDDKLLKSLGIDGRILYPPGHTDDSISLLLSDGNAFVGDLAENMLNFCMCDRRTIGAKNYDEMFKSWEKIIRNGAKTIYTAHGHPFDVKELLSSMKKHWEKDE